MTEIKTSISTHPKDKIYSRNILRREDVTLYLLKDVQKISAEIVKQHGDLYLPVFIRIHEEIEKRKNNQSYKQIALQIALNDS